MEKLYYSIGEVAGILDENVSLVRFWSDTFPKFIRPVRNAKGNRMYTAEDLATFKKIHFLVKECGMTLEGTAKKLLNESEKINNAVNVIDSLRRMRAQLEDVRNNL